MDSCKLSRGGGANLEWTLISDFHHPPPAVNNVTPLEEMKYFYIMKLRICELHSLETILTKVN